ncbi:MAG: DUF1971 domain-containing protein [Alphaproteobacteria bacterium]|nr:MAG: DUF1971 domain-containing protein [Alphaproteobacteria bacterium]
MSSQLPKDVRAYKRTPTFSEATVPAGLLGRHATKAGVWGLIRVEEGELHYVITDPRREITRLVLTPLSEPGVVEPTIIHHVETAGAVRFHVEFLRP